MVVNFSTNIFKINNSYNVFAKAPKNNTVSFKALNEDKFEPSNKADNSIAELFMSLDKKYFNAIKKYSAERNIDLTALLFDPERCPQKKLNMLHISNFLSDKLSTGTISPKQGRLLFTILNNITLYEKTEEGVSQDYLAKFIETLTSCNYTLLKNIVDNKIPIAIYDDAVLYKGLSHASYCQGKKIIPNEYDVNGLPMIVIDEEKRGLKFAEKAFTKPITILGQVQNTYESLPHELGHAFDYCNGTKLGLSPQDCVTMDFVNKDNNLRHMPLASFSKEFDKAFFDDYVLMGKKDEQNGRAFGTTFKELLKNPNFSYYIGADPKTIKRISPKDTNGNIIRKLLFDDVTARKELFAQAISYVTAGYVTNSEFNERIEELFPNILNFAKDTINKAEELQ